MALTVETLATALRLDTPLETEQGTILTRLMGVGQAIVGLYGSGAPEGVQDEAVIRIAAYLYDMPEVPTGSRYAMAWRNSGASSLLGPWIVRGASIIQAGSGAGGGTDGVLTALNQHGETLAALQGELAALRSQVGSLVGRIEALENA